MTARLRTLPGRRAAVPLLSLAVLLAAWWLVVELRVWPELFVPSPAAVWDRFIESVTVHDGQRGLSGYYLHEHLWASLWRILRGVGFALVFGVALGLALATFTPLRLLVEPYVNFIRALPPLAYFSLLIIWFGIEDTSKVWLLFLAALPSRCRCSRACGGSGASGSTPRGRSAPAAGRRSAS